VKLHLVLGNSTINSNYTEKPVIAEPQELGWGGCEDIDYDKYPSGIPGCDNFVNENAGQLGVIPTDMVSDARLPVETHVPPYPLSANPNLPDVSASYIGNEDFDTPQDPAGWTVPDWNHNGCLGGPCDQSRDERAHINEKREAVDE